MGETPMLRMETNAVLTRRLRVLLSAFSFSPVGGSEPAVGWQIASRLAQHHDVVVLCSPGIQDRSRRRDIEQHIQEKGLPAGLSVEFIEPPAVSRFLQRDNRN